MELLTDSTVQEVVRAATKRQVEVEKWSSKPFAANFCLMRSLEVHIKKDGEASVLNFLAKHTSDGTDIFTSYRHRAFAKEIFFYGTLAPLLNEELKKAGMEPLSIPRCFYAASSADSALLVMEDLRSRGFRASQFLIDEAHGFLLVKELAKLHAASLMLRDRGDEPLTERFPYLVESWTLGEEHRGPFKTYTSTGTTTMAEMFCTRPELQELRRWLERVAPNSLLLIMRQLEHMPHTSVITHGDIHTRNCLFSEMKSENKNGEAGLQNIQEHAEENEDDAAKKEKELNINHIEEIKQVLTETADYALNLGVHKQFADIENHLWKE
ncbi:Protein of unknown function DUF227 [Trinorchestia longiramus]|nr:Protein of unknown function DUF227 [Trinorchestia longiramus]